MGICHSGPSIDFHTDNDTFKIKYRPGGFAVRINHIMYHYSNTFDKYEVVLTFHGGKKAYYSSPYIVNIRNSLAKFYIDYQKMDNDYNITLKEAHDTVNMSVVIGKITLGSYIDNIARKIGHKPKHNLYYKGDGQIIEDGLCVGNTGRPVYHYQSGGLNVIGIATGAMVGGALGGTEGAVIGGMMGTVL